jgi:hypothetical protein
MEEMRAEKPSELSNPVIGVIKRINARVRRTLANPNLTPEQKQELFTLVNLTKQALSSGNPVVIPLAQELNEFINPLEPPEVTAEQK